MNPICTRIRSKPWGKILKRTKITVEKNQFKTFLDETLCFDLFKNVQARV